MILRLTSIDFNHVRHRLGNARVSEMQYVNVKVHDNRCLFRIRE